MSRRRRKKRLGNEVELNLAAMLDMAFQLLTFFILTFRPAPIEGQVNLRLPPPHPMTKVASAQASGTNDENPNPLEGLETLTITLIGTPQGQIQTLAVGESAIASPRTLDLKLREIFGDPGQTFEQVVIQVGPLTRYNELMQIVDICTNQKLPNGEKLSKLSFVELPYNSE